MSQKITDELLRENGWQGFVNTDEGFFVFEDLTLLYDHEKGIHGFAGHKYDFTNWEELLAGYKEIKGKDFISGTPATEKKWIFLGDDETPFKRKGNVE